MSITLLGAAGIVFSASFPSGFAALEQSSEATKAASIAQEKMEQIRAVSYADLNYATLNAAGHVDNNPTSSPFSFTLVDGVATDLNSGTGSIAITNEGGGVMRVTVAVNWLSTNGISRNVTVTTLVADMSPWVE
ncbi:MAG: hypothetical protein Q7N50_00375 [Armatimonadota bacterium]|nr:hypothetical protein [Armatimonadota bacterium]